MMGKVMCFGEMLWDCFPNEKLPGGAPMNVALHLKQLGIEAKLISRIGNDGEGEKLMHFMEGYQLDKDLIQIDKSFPTGQVKINDSDKENMSYDIIAPAAWDFIATTNELKQETTTARAIVFGSLAVRNKETWETLKTLVDSPILKVFDINLRSPFIDYTKIEYLLGKTTILKINEVELELLANYFKLATQQRITEKLCEYLRERYSIQIICITLGSKGAMIFQEGLFFTHPGYRIKVEDTVGAGDAFLSGFIKMYLAEKKPKEILDFSCKLGAFVASKRGGTPKYTLAELHQFK